MLHPLPKYFERGRGQSFGEGSKHTIDDNGPSGGPSKLGRWHEGNSQAITLSWTLRSGEMQAHPYPDTPASDLPHCPDAGREVCLCSQLCTSKAPGHLLCVPTRLV